MTVAALSILLGLGDIINRLMARSFKESENFALGVSSITSRVALAPAAARATVDACFPGKQKFIVTRKSALLHNCQSNVSLAHRFLFALAVGAYVICRSLFNWLLAHLHYRFRPRGG